jgi:hypothetical protein
MGLHVVERHRLAVGAFGDVMRFVAGRSAIIIVASNQPPSSVSARLAVDLCAPVAR